MCLSEDDGWRLCGCVLDLWVMPVVCGIGLLLNCGCLIVFFSSRDHPLVPALIVLSMSDCLQLLLSFFVLFVPALHDFAQASPYGALGERLPVSTCQVLDVLSGQLAYLSTGILSPLLLAVNCASIWTICYISVQRHKAILRPLSNIHSPLRPFKPLITISFVALLFNACKWVEFNWKWVSLETNSSTTWLLMHEPSDLARNESYHLILDNLLYPILVYLIPLLLLSILNFRILTNVSNRRVVFDHRSRFAQERRSVILLISIVIMFFLCHTGGLAIRFVDQTKYMESELFVLLKDVINLLFNVNSLANPMLYFLFTRKFRDLRMILHSHFASPASRSESLANQQSQAPYQARHRHLSAPTIYRTPCHSGTTRLLS